MKVLVTVASRHGNTAEIGSAIGRRLAACGLVVDVLEPEQVGSLEGYDAVVLGSAVYMGRWLEPAKRFAAARRDELARLPVWLFSSGPTGDPPLPAEPPADPPEVARLTGAREHRLFPGVMGRGQLALTEKAIVTMVRARDGDYRPWAEINAWADAIAAAVQSEQIATDKPSEEATP